MSKKDEPIPDPLAGEGGGFGVFKPAPRKSAAAGKAKESGKTSSQTVSSSEQRPAAQPAGASESGGISTSVWGGGGGPSVEAVPPPVPPVQTVAPLVDDTAHFAPTSVLIGAELAIRFEYYQAKVKTKTGTEPSISAVVLEALNHCHDEDLRTYREIIQNRRKPPQAASGPFSGAAPRRRAATGGRMTVQLPIRPTKSELNLIDHFSKQVGAQSRSEFIDGVLERFLNTVANDMPRTFKPKRQMGTPR
ncbi:hypothetical protein AB0C84_41980 [Actinomadura sp. NPDC048955]|uniref:hypothetical protein n=1 Tax=Actinomadura sp. NPDC048955 TaxID=3158228 RepID=UPI00340BDF26